MKSNTSLQFGKYFLDDQKLKKLLHHRTYKKYIKAKKLDLPLTPHTLNAVLKAIMEWAITQGATHYSHIFYPLFRPSAEKHLAFLSIKDGNTTPYVSPHELMFSEVDASSFPNGDACPPHKAKGCVMWDITAPPYISCNDEGEKTLYLPSKFFSYDNICLDEKTPLLKATRAIDTEAKRVLEILGIKTKKVVCNVGAEQEFFLIKKNLLESRYDLSNIGHTIVDNSISPIATFSSHYLSKPTFTISSLFDSLSNNLWEKGISAKIRHSEVSPSQYEITTIFGEANKICDQNNEIMHSIKNVAGKFNFAPLFHEKPFKNTSGSGKHINLSFCTNKGLNLLDPSTTPAYIFFVFFSAFIVAIDTHKDLILESVKSYANNLRLGQKEAPPPNLTIHVGENLTQKLLNFNYQKINKKPIKHSNDNRNRTSPLAFVKNRFEFRMAGSSESIASPLIAIYIAFSSVLKHIADEAEKIKGNKIKGVLKISKELFEKHNNIIYNGDNYSKVQNASCPHRASTFDLSSTSIESATNLGVFSDAELLLRKKARIQKFVCDLSSDAIIYENMLNKFVHPSIIHTLDFYKSRPEIISSDDICKKLISTTNKLFDLQTELSEILTQASMLEQNEKLKWLLRFVPNKLDSIDLEFKKIKNLIPKEFEPFPSCDEIIKPL